MTFDNIDYFRTIDEYYASIHAVQASARPTTIFYSRLRPAVQATRHCRCAQYDSAQCERGQNRYLGYFSLTAVGIHRTGSLHTNSIFESLEFTEKAKENSKSNWNSAKRIQPREFLWCYLIASHVCGLFLIRLLIRRSRHWQRCRFPAASEWHDSSYETEHVNPHLRIPSD